MPQAIYRFAPSPNGELHLGHAYSALLNQQLARSNGARLLVRIEDIDVERCSSKLERQMLDDLEWLGIEWNETPRRQSEHLSHYREALEKLGGLMLVYPARTSRAEIRRQIGELQSAGRDWPHDPDGVPHYPGNERDLSQQAREKIRRSADKFALRLDISKALEKYSYPLKWHETGSGPTGQSGMITANPAQWGDVLLGRKDTPTSYHLACVIDDALQGVSHIVRGHDLFHATSLHRLLQEILCLPAPKYLHHRLILDADGKKLSKSRKDTSLRQLRRSGMQPQDIRQMVGLDQELPKP